MADRTDSAAVTRDAAMGVGTTHAGFVVTRALDVPELRGTAYVMRHEATGARLMWIANDDTNRSFSIAFKTPPTNDTGVFHILEHSVLCGSDRFPVKEPFVNLLKTSMQTFLNALTFPDKTMYPVASTNEQDLLNLMDVYLDAVLHPAIYHRPRIFQQEGWHYEISGEKDGEVELTRNGVVLNEMKGAFSDPDEVLMEALNRDLFPDTAYRWESGGDPRHIPELTYEEFVDTHARHYRLDNSYTVLYGDLDIERVLAFVGERFDGAADRGAGAPNELALQACVEAAPREVEMPTDPKNACVGMGLVVGRAGQRERLLACDDWGVTLGASREVAPDVSHAGIRAHYLRVVSVGEGLAGSVPGADASDGSALGGSAPGAGDNLIPCVVDRVIDSTFSTIVMLATPGGARLRYELEKDEWAALESRGARPGACLTMAIDPSAVMPLRDVAGGGAR